MENFRADVHDMIQYLLGYPSTKFEFGLLLMGTVTLLTIMSTRVGRTSPEGEAGRYTAIPVTLFGVSGLFLGLGLARSFLGPHLNGSIIEPTLIITACVFSVVMASLAMGLFQRATFTAASAHWTVGLFLAGLLVWLVGMTSESLTSGAGKIEKAKSRAVQVEAFLERQ